MSSPMTKAFVRPDVRQFLDFIEANPAPRMSEVGPVEARAMMRGMRDMADVPIGDLAVMRDVAMPARDDRTIALRIFDAREARGPSPTLVFFHGGGFVLGDLYGYEPACAELARQLDMPVISVDYRLAPEHPWPAGPDDCEAAARWIAESPERLGVSVTGLILMGDSAGGALTAVTAMALRDLPASVPVLAQCMLYPVTDLAKPHPSYQEFGEGHLLEATELKWFWECYAADNEHWRASPIFGDFAGLPPTLVFTSSLDPLRDEGRAFAAAAVAAGVPTVFQEARGMIHGFLNFRQAMPSAVDDVNQTIAALKYLLAESSRAEAR